MTNEKNNKWMFLLYGILASFLGSIPGAIYLIIVLVIDEYSPIPTIFIFLGALFGYMVMELKKKKEKEKDKNSKEFDAKRYVRDTIAPTITKMNPSISFVNSILAIVISIIVSFFSFIISVGILLIKIEGVNPIIAFFQALPRFFMESYFIDNFISSSIVILIFGVISFLKSKVWGF